MSRGLLVARYGDGDDLFVWSIFYGRGQGVVKEIAYERVYHGSKGFFSSVFAVLLRMLAVVVGIWLLLHGLASYLG